MEPIKLTFTPTPLKKLSSVVIIDDNQMEVEMLKEYFSKYDGLTTTSFTGGEECIKAIVMSGNSPDLILIDYFLDQGLANSKDGLEVLVKLKEISPDSTILMHTSVENQKIIDLARKKGAFDYIIKGTEGFKKLDSILEKHFTIQNNK